ncbi:MAG TPA: aldo/keto reductase [Methylomirabilota bacterium]|nr:aldo/keto reductase [Methylomirabilota bacterium]
MKSRWSRREFLKGTTAAVVLGAAEKALGATASLSGLPKRRLGKTGETVSCIGFGSGTRFCSIPDEDAAQALLERAFALGINYFDTAGSYTRRPLERLSEKRLGEFSKGRRKQIFLATKIDPRDRDGALRSVETSLEFLQTDYLDLIQIHSLSNLNDLDRIGSADGVLGAVQQLKNQKVARFIGITGHNDGTAMTEALRRHDFDTVLMALNAAQSANPVAARKMEPIPAFENSALPVALQKNMGILSMKVMGQGMLVGNGAGRAPSGELLQFNLSQPVACVVIGCEQMAPLEQNVQAALNFTPMSENGKQRLQEKVAPSRSAWQHFLESHDDSAAA